MNKRMKLLLAKSAYEFPYLLFRVNQFYNHKEKYSYEKRFFWSQGVMRRLTKRSRVHLIVSGQENIPQEPGFMMTPNHQGMFDIFALFDSLHVPFKIVYKQELRNIKVLAKVLDYLEYPVIDRSNLRASMKVIHRVTKELKEGYNYVIFPEGTRSKQGNVMGEFKGGSFKAAIDAKATILPVAFVNSFEVLDTESLKKLDVEMHFFPAIPYEDYKDMTSTDIAAKVHDEIQSYIDASIYRH